MVLEFTSSVNQNVTASRKYRQLWIYIFTFCHKVDNSEDAHPSVTSCDTLIGASLQSSFHRCHRCSHVHQNEIFCGPPATVVTVICYHVLKYQNQLTQSVCANAASYVKTLGIIRN